jgi:hypothetical protein
MKAWTLQQLVEVQLFLVDGTYPAHVLNVADPDLSKSRKQHWRRQTKDLDVQDGVVVFKSLDDFGQLVVVPVVASDDDARVQAMWVDCHTNGGHSDVSKTYNKVRAGANCDALLWFCLLIARVGVLQINSRCYGITRAVVERLNKECETCACYNKLSTRETLKPIRTYGVWQHVQMDFVDYKAHAEANDEYKWLLTIVDTFSKYAFAFPTKDRSAPTVALILFNLFVTEGTPEVCHRDLQWLEHGQLMPASVLDRNRFCKATTAVSS